MSMIKADICIIGAGAAGLSVAAAASQFGAKTVLIEKNEMGGDCLNTGCVPSKRFISLANKYHHQYKYPKSEVDSKTTLQMSKLMASVKMSITALKEHDSVERFESLGVNVLLEAATFIDKYTIKTDSHTIKAKYFIIATGSTPFIPPIPGLADIPYYTNESIFDLNETPKHLAIIGGGPIGCELGQAFARLNIKTSIIEAQSILAREDTALVSQLKKVFTQDGLNHYEKVKIEKIEQQNNDIIISLTNDQGSFSLNASHLLVATGRKVDVSHLGLKQANVECSPKGIVVNQKLQTSQKNIYAMGDAIGQLQFTHVASYHASIIIRNIFFHLGSKVSYHAVPRVTYTTPALASVGISEQDIKPKDNFTITEFSYGQNDRAVIEDKTTGAIKVISTKRGKILGVSILGEQADNLIMPWVMAISLKKSLKAISQLVFPYPTYSEISKSVASEYYKPIVFSKKMKKILKWINGFGKD